jgi:hypothetical protein
VISVVDAVSRSDGRRIAQRRTPYRAATDAVSRSDGRRIAQRRTPYRAATDIAGRENSDWAGSLGSDCTVADNQAGTGFDVRVRGA